MQRYMDKREGGLGLVIRDKRQTTFYGDVVLVEAKKDAGLILLTIETGCQDVLILFYTTRAA